MGGCSLYVLNIAYRAAVCKGDIRSYTALAGFVTVHSIAVNSNVSRHLESPLAMGEIHSGQNVHPPCQSAE